MGARASQLLGLEQAPVTIEDTVRGITTQVLWNIRFYYNYSKFTDVVQIDTAQKPTTSGQFVNYNGDKVAW